MGFIGSSKRVLQGLYKGICWIMGLGALEFETLALYGFRGGGVRV